MTSINHKGDVKKYGNECGIEMIHDKCKAVIYERYNRAIEKPFDVCMLGTFLLRYIPFITRNNSRAIKGRKKKKRKKRFPRKKRLHSEVEDERKEFVRG